ncbi:MAG: thiamine pyrophosphate-binding protein [Rhodovibrionaceae bacterium]
MPRRHGGQILADHLKTEGVPRVFCVPGESYLAALDGLYKSGIEVVVCRQEGGAAMMAEAQGKLTGRPGICFVTRGPGATNAASGVHVAFQDSTPMILFVGQVARGMQDREAFQEVDYRRMYAPLAKWVEEVSSVERLPEYLSRAFHIAQSGRPGPVVLALPEDVLSAEAELADAKASIPGEPKASPEDAGAILDALEQAQQPMVLVGGGGWSAEAGRDLAAFAAAHDLPVAGTFRCQDYLHNASPNYVGYAGLGNDPRLAQRIRDADLLLVIGARIGEATSNGYGLIDIPQPRQRLIHSHPGASELGRVYRPDLAINASSPSLLARLAALSGHNDRPWAAWRAEAREDALAWATPRETPGRVKLEQVIAHLGKVLPADAILANGAGNYAAFLHRYFRYRGYRTQLAPTSGSMGYGLPAAIAAKLQHPERTVICLAGDGCFQMTGQELATAMQVGAAIVVIVANNGIYGTIRMHQEREYPGRVSGTSLVNPDFAALARAHGAHGETVEDTAGFPAALQRALAAGKAALIELKTDPEAISPATTISALRRG